tara:strand:- start:767 stop:946 length:180 start_codon:yes stop_codon:yes gene_type:complete
MDTEKRTPQKMSSPDVELEIDLLEGQTSSPKKVKAIPASSTEITRNKELSKKEKKGTEE